MDYLDARWLLLKRLSPDALERLHRREKHLWRRTLEGKTFSTEPVWWQGGLNLLSRESREQGGFWGTGIKFEDKARRTAAFRASAEAELARALPKLRRKDGPGLELENLYGDMELLHACDRVVRERVPAPDTASPEPAARAKAALAALEQ